MSDKKGIKTLLSKVKIEYLIVIVLGCICLLIVFGSVNQNKNKTTTNTINEYVDTLENKLKTSLSKVSGAGKVNVIISVESGMETVLATTTIKEDNTYL